MFIDECGFVYTITCKANGRVYVGHTTWPARRFGLHAYDLRNLRHTNGELQDDWDQYGEEQFSMETVSFGTPETEKELIQELLSKGTVLYNVPDQSRYQHISNAVTKVWSDLEFRTRVTENMQRAWKRNLSYNLKRAADPERRRKISETMRARWKNPAFRDRVNKAREEALRTGPRKSWGHRREK